MRYLGLDLGSKTLGIAMSDDKGIIASCLKVIRHDEEYERLVAEKKIEGIVLGLPKNMNNTLGFKGELSLKFKEMLEEKVSVPVFLQDERLTTVSANNVLIDGGMSRKKRKKVVDGVAATIILQTFLDKENYSEETNKNYIVYTDNSKDEEGNIQVYASVYDPENPKSKLEPIETEKEWKVIETILNTLQEEIKNKMDDSDNEQ